MPQTPPKATFQMSYPTGDSSFSSSNFRNNFQSLYEGDFLPLRALAHATPDSSLMILGADAGDFSVPIYYGHANQKVYVSASGDTSNFSYPAGNDRIDVVHMDASGDFHITAGSEAASPVIPPFPSGEVIPVVAVYHRLGSTKIANYADKDSYSGDSYIYRDMRPLYSLPKASDTSDLATKALDNLSSVAINEDLLPDSDNARDLGSAAKEFKDLYLDGTANIDSLVADTADINGGTLDGVQVGGTTATGELLVNNSSDAADGLGAQGTAGEVLTSAGAGANPSWEAAETRNVDAAAGDVLINSIDAASPNSVGHPLNNTRQISVQADGTYRITFDLYGLEATGRIYRNGAAVGTLQSRAATSYETFSEDISGWSAGDLVQLYASDAPNKVAYVRNFRVSSDLWSLASSVATNYTS